MKTIAVVNKKGGVGKTSVCYFTAGVLAEQGHKVLIVDMDDQGSLSGFFIKNVHNVSPTVNDLLTEEPSVGPEEVIRPTPIKDIFLLPGNITLKNLDARLAGDYDAHFYLMEALQEVADNYHYILIDCPPSLGQATRMAMIASDTIIAPIDCDKMAVAGAKLLIAEIERVRKRTNPKLQFKGFIINKYMHRAVDKAFNRAIRQVYGDKVFKTEFFNHVQYKEAITRGLPITHYQPKSEQAMAFRQFVQELLAA